VNTKGKSRCGEIDGGEMINIKMNEEIDEV
jgi:hypothetical protein